MSISIKLDFNTLRFVLNQAYNNSKQIHDEFKNKEFIEIPKQIYIVEYTLYILLLDTEALYVGRTEREFSIRLKEHRSGHGSKFTGAYRYGDIEPILTFNYKSNDRYLDIETNLTFCLMKVFGYKNVRGGTFNKVVIKNDPTKDEEHLSCYIDEPVEEYIEEIKDYLKINHPTSLLLKNLKN